MKLIHICPDEKFIDDAIAQLDSYKNIESLYFILLRYSESRYVKTIKQNVVFFRSQKSLISKIKKDYPNCIVVLHGLCINLIYLSTLKQPIILCCWGAEIYSDIRSKRKNAIQLELYKPETRILFYESDRILKKIKDLMKYFLGYYYLRNRLYFKFFEKVVAVSTVYPEEFKMLPVSGKLYFPFHYTNPRLIDPIFIEKKDIFSSCPRVMVGNSLDPTNNHIDILKKINALGEDIEVLLPICYGGKANYKESLKRRIAKLTHIRPIYIETFLKKEEYFKQVNQCCAIIMGHIRQQAVGNIDWALHNGFDVYMYKDSINYNHYKKIDCVIHSIDDDLARILSKEGLSVSEQKHNFDIITNYCNYNKYYDSMVKFFNECTL